MNRPLRIAFLGTPAIAVPTLRMLALQGGRPGCLEGSRAIHAVFCNPDKPQGRGHHLEAPPVKQAALELGLPVYQPVSWKREEVKGFWHSLDIDMAIVVAYGHILPSWMLDSCPLGAWNLHFSLLPRWRGASPVNHAIMEGDPETGVSLMRITPGLDAGPVVAMSRRPILETDTTDTLLARLAEDAAHLLCQNLDSFCQGNIQLTPQDDQASTYAPKLNKDMSRLDFGSSAQAIHRKVRALQPWPGVEFQMEDTLIKLLAVGGYQKSHEKPGTLCWDKDGAWLTAGDDMAVELVKLQRPGKPAQSALQALQPWGKQGSLSIQ